jgi:hypothetical protein
MQDILEQINHQIKDYAPNPVVNGFEIKRNPVSGEVWAGNHRTKLSKWFASMNRDLVKDAVIWALQQ